MRDAVCIRFIDGEKDGKGLKLITAARVLITEYCW